METTLIERIAGNPNPFPVARNRTWAVRRVWLASIAWGRSLDRDAAIDSGRNVLATIGAGTILADFGTMRVWMALPCVVLAAGVWYMDYLRHF